MSSEEVNKEYYTNFWNENMIKYLSQSAGGRWFEYLFGLVLAEIPVDSVRTAADIGCGVGNKTAMMAKYLSKAEVTGYDFSEPGIVAAKKHHMRGNLHFATKDITKSSSNDMFDLITAFDVLEHIEDWVGLTKKIININNRYILISSPVGKMRPYEASIGHVRNFKKGEIESLMESQGYRTAKVFYAGFPFYSPIIRDITNLFYKQCAILPQKEMSTSAKLIHNIWYFLFRYCSSKKRGDIFIGLFEKSGTSTKKEKLNAA